MGMPYKKVLLAVLIALVIEAMPVFAYSSAIAENNGVKLDIPEAKQVQGHIRISGNTSNEKIKLLVSGGDKQIWYDIELSDGKFDKELWFDNPGKYTIQVMVNEYDRKYSYGPQITVLNSEALSKYLIPGKHIESNEDIIIETAREITKTCSSDTERARAIYDWVTSNIEFDYEKLSNHKEGKYDNEYGALNTITTGKGVCYDYSALTAALARSLGIQAKLAEGDLNKGELKGFHAWNELLISETNCWISLDTTLGATTGEDYFDFANNDESHTAYEYK